MDINDLMWLIKGRESAEIEVRTITDKPLHIYSAQEEDGKIVIYVGDKEWCITKTTSKMLDS